MHKKVYSIVVLVMVLGLGLWAAAPAKYAAAQANEDATTPCDHGSTFLVGRTAELPHISERIHDICNFRVNMDNVPKNVSEFDKDFVEDSITSNTLELQSLQFALDHTSNEEWRGQIQMMIAMHTSDLQMALDVAKKIGADTEPDLTHASVYPETPDYDLGKRFENLVEEYLNPLMMAAGGTTVTPTGVPTEAMTGTPTEIPTMDLTGTPTDVPTGVGPLTEVPTLDMTTTATTIPPVDVTMTPTGTGTSPNFDVTSLNIIEDEHVADVQAELTAERLVQNEELKAFAKHSADVTELHLLLMGDLKHRLVDNYTPPDPDFQADYQSPRTFGPK